MVSHKHEPPMAGLAFLKCQNIYPKAFRPVKLSQRCKTEPLMKYINLEHWASIHIIVLMSHHRDKREWGDGWGRGVINLTSMLLRIRVCNDLVTGTHWYIGYTAVSSSRIEKMKCLSNSTDPEEEGGEKTELSLSGPHLSGLPGRCARLLR